MINMTAMNSIHGGIDVRALKKAGINPDDVLDFSVSINPAPLPKPIQKVIHHSPMYRYPDSRCLELVENLSAEYGPAPEEILVVNGTSQAIFLIASSYLKPGDTTLIAGPTYSEYRDASQVFGGRILEIRAWEKDDFRPDIKRLTDGIRGDKPKVFWICSPNNPTGSWLTQNQISPLVDACNQSGTLMVLDEAYRCFAPPKLLTNIYHPGIIHLRSMTKDFCIPGLRLGWLRGDPSVVSELRRRQPNWSVSVPAQNAGTACMGHLDYFRKSWEETRLQTNYLEKELKNLGLKVYPTAANFLLVKIGDDAAVKALSTALWRSLIQVRDCASFGLEGFIRIGTPSARNADILILAMRDILQ